MRKIKFRVWHLDLEVMNYKHCFGEDIRSNYLNIKDNDILLQYTGQKDRNGVDIWEGDIVKQTYVIGIELESTRLGEVYWCDGEAGFAIAWGDSCSQFNSFQWSSYEVIGNIYVNPELRIIKDEA